MNKIIWISAAVLSVAACAKNEVVPVNSGENQEITFNVAPKTKAAPKPEPDPKPEPEPKKEAFSTNNVFASWAYYLPTGTDWDDKSDKPENETYPKEYISGATIVNNANTEGKWKCEGKSYYWPKNGTLTFFAYSLNKGDLTLEGENSKFSCRPDAGISGQINMFDNPNTDFLVAEIAKNKTENVKTHFTEGVPTLFHHKLSKIVFNVKAGEYKRTSFSLKSIQFKNIGCFGVYNQIPEGFSYGLVSKLYNPYYSKNNQGQSVISTPAVVNSVENEIFIPQTFADNATIEVVYTITTKVLNSDDVVETVTKTIKLKELFPTKYDNSDPQKVIGGGWEMGKKYTINLTFTLDEILWDPAVQDWEGVNIGTDTKPIIVG